MNLAKQVGISFCSPTFDVLRLCSQKEPDENLKAAYLNILSRKVNDWGLKKIVQIRLYRLLHPHFKKLWQRQSVAGKLCISLAKKYIKFF